MLININLLLQANINLILTNFWLQYDIILLLPLLKLKL